MEGPSEEGRGWILRKGVVQEKKGGDQERGRDISSH